MKTLFSTLLLLLCLSALAQPPFLRNRWTTNSDSASINGSGLNNLNPANLTGGGLVPDNAVYVAPPAGGPFDGPGVVFLVNLINGTQYQIVSYNGDGLWDTNANQFGDANGRFTATSNGPAFFFGAGGSVGDPVLQQLKVIEVDPTPAIFTEDVYFGDITFFGNIFSPTHPVPSLTASQSWTGQQTLYTNLLLYNTNQYIFAGTVSATIGSKTFTAASGSFAGLVPGDYLICTNGGSSVSQYRIVKVRNSTTLIADTIADHTYTAVHAVTIYPNTSQFYDLNGNLQAAISQDGSFSIFGLANDGTANSGRMEWNNGTNTFWADEIFDSVDNWWGLSAWNLGWHHYLFKVNSLAPEGSLTVDRSGNTFAGVSVQSPVGTFGTVTFTNTALSQNFTITAAASTGNKTINNQFGSIRIAASGTTVTLTDSVITTSSIVLANVATADTTAKSVSAVPSSGSCLFTLNAAATAEVEIRWGVFTQ